MGKLGNDPFRRAAAPRLAEPAAAAEPVKLEPVETKKPAAAAASKDTKASAKSSGASASGAPGKPAKSADAQKQSVANKPAATAKPTAAATLSAAAKPVTAAKPAAANKPGPAAKPPAAPRAVAAAKPGAAAKPVASATTVAAAEPAAPASAVAALKASADSSPAAEADSVEVTKLAAATKPLATRPEAPVEPKRAALEEKVLSRAATPEPQPGAIEEPVAVSETEPEPIIAREPTLADRAKGTWSIVLGVLANALTKPELLKVADAASGIYLALRTALGIAGPASLDPYGKDSQLVERLSPLIDFLYDTYWRVTVENAAALPEGPCIVVANHAGALPLDGPVLAQAIARERPELAEARWLVEDQIFYAPFVGTLFNRLGAIRASPENAERLLAEKRPLLVFPEGMHGLAKPFAERYQLKRFGRGGFVKLALRTGAPIVPAAIVGAEDASPLFGKLPGGALGLPYVPVTAGPLPAKWMIRFGAPIEVQKRGDELAFVQGVTERVRGEIEAMLTALLKERPRVFVR